MGIPATGTRVRIGYIDLWRIVDGKGVENWVRLDMAAMMQQLGAVGAGA
jgi:predicted ester cyclase